MVIRTALAFVLLCAAWANSQNVPGLQWQQCRPDLQAVAAVRLSDGNLLVALQNADTASSSDLWLSTYDILGNLLTEHLLPAPVGGKQTIHSLTASAAALLISGSVDSAGQHYRSLWCTDLSGQLLWSYKELFHDSLTVRYGKAIRSAQGTVAWLTEQISAQMRDLHLLLLSSAGAPLVSVSFGGSDNEFAADILEKPNGGFLLLATTFSDDANPAGKVDSSDLLLINTDAGGNILWSRCYGGTNYEYAAALDWWGNKYLIGGSSRSSLGGVSGHHGTNDFYDAWLVAVDTSGNILWNNSYGGKQDEFLTGMQIIGKNAAVIGATAYSANAQVTDHIGPTWQSDYWTFLVDSLGKFKWGKSVGGTWDDFSTCFLALDSLRYVHAGGSLSSDGNLNGGCAQTGNTPLAGAWIALLNASCPSFAQASFAVTTDTLSVSLINNSVEATNYIWTFGDGASSNQIHPSHQFAFPGTYTVCLIASNSCSSDTLCVPVTVCLPPQAQFSFAVMNDSIQFYDQSPYAVQWYWDFGDGHFSTSEFPMHRYDQPGVYVVTLIATNACGQSDTLQQSINLCLAIQPTIVKSVSGLSVAFSAAISVSPDDWFWDFGDGVTSTLPSPQHAYADTGSYTVCLTVNFNGCDPITTCTVVTVCQLPQSAFSYSDNELQVEFFNNSVAADTFFWDFGDGSFSMNVQPEHTYSSAGSYWVCLIAANACSADTFCQFITLTCTPPEALFSVSTNELQADFLDLSVLAQAWQWDFGDGTTSTDEHPSHIYSDPGTYNVCLTAINSCSADTFCLPVLITCTLPQAAFDFEAQNLIVAFENLSDQGNSWLWLFGDGNVSTEQHPVHLYAEPGTYSVCLIATNDCGADTFCLSLTLTCPLPGAAFSATTDYLTVHFTNLSTNADSLLWLLGDGQTSSAQMFSYTYSAPGIYGACLIAFNSCGSDTTCLPLELSCPPLLPEFTYVISNDTVYFTDLTAGSISWLWDFGDGSTSTLASPFHLFVPGSYTVCLTVSDGCSSQTTCDSLIFVHQFAVQDDVVLMTPNPTIGLVHLKASFPIVSIHVRNALGQVLIQNTLSEPRNSFSLDLTALPAGSYFVQISSEKKRHLFRVVRQ
ncbi:MAG: PKD domain-containing protein [Chitinophagales bacterium]|nr:PKD domain-containing protein [Chitinophagales bacterium]